MPKPPTRVSLRWTGDLTFMATARDHAIVVDGDSRTGLSPVELLGVSLATCMGTDVAHILTRGRQNLVGLDVELVADRSPDDPHRFVAARLHFAVRGEVSQALIVSQSQVPPLPRSASEKAKPPRPVATCSPITP